MRPGRAPDGSLLFPLAKSRAGENAPVFAVEVLYLSAGTAWPEKGHATLMLPELDLPVSRTGLALYHPPQHRVTAEAGAFRVQAFEAASPASWGRRPWNPLRSAGYVCRDAGFSGRAVRVAMRAGRRRRRRRDAFPAVGPSVYRQ